MIRYEIKDAGATLWAEIFFGNTFVCSYQCRTSHMERAIPAVEEAIARALNHMFLESDSDFDKRSVQDKFDADAEYDGYGRWVG